MQLYWQGTDITESVNVTGCVIRDACGDRTDMLELKLDRAADWYRWAPEEDDEIILTDGVYTTGTMYLNAVIPEGDQYRVLATGTKRAAARKQWKSYLGLTLGELFDSCASECGMTYKLFGIDERLFYTYILRDYTGPGAFLNMIGEWEGLAVKTFNGAFEGIYRPFAEEQDPVAGFAIEADQPGVTWRKRTGEKLSSLTVRTPCAEAVARDESAEGNNPATITFLPAMDNAQAGRWARNLLAKANRAAESLTLETALNTDITALSRVEISGTTPMSGTWICEDAEHDLIEKASRIKLSRITDTIQ